MREGGPDARVTDLNPHGDGMGARAVVGLHRQGAADVERAAALNLHQPVHEVVVDLIAGLPDLGRDCAADGGARDGRAEGGRIGLEAAAFADLRLELVQRERGLDAGRDDVDRRADRLPDCFGAEGELDPVGGDIVDGEIAVENIDGVGDEPGLHLPRHGKAHPVVPRRHIRLSGNLGGAARDEDARYDLARPVRVGVERHAASRTRVCEALGELRPRETGRRLRVGVPIGARVEEGLRRLVDIRVFGQPPEVQIGERSGEAGVAGGGGAEGDVDGAGGVVGGDIQTVADENPAEFIFRLFRIEAAGRPFVDLDILQQRRRRRRRPAKQYRPDGRPCPPVRRRIGALQKDEAVVATGRDIERPAEDDIARPIGRLVGKARRHVAVVDHHRAQKRAAELAAARRIRPPDRHDGRMGIAERVERDAPGPILECRAVDQRTGVPAVLVVGQRADPGIGGAFPRRVRHGLAPRLVLRGDADVRGLDPGTAVLRPVDQRLHRPGGDRHRPGRGQLPARFPVEGAVTHRLRLYGGAAVGQKGQRGEVVVFGEEVQQRRLKICRAGNDVGTVFGHREAVGAGAFLRRLFGFCRLDVGKLHLLQRGEGDAIQNAVVFVGARTGPPVGPEPAESQREGIPGARLLLHPQRALERSVHVDLRPAIGQEAGIFPALPRFGQPLVRDEGEGAPPAPLLLRRVADAGGERRLAQIGGGADRHDRLRPRDAAFDRDEAGARNGVGRSEDPMLERPVAKERPGHRIASRRHDGGAVHNAAEAKSGRQEAAEAVDEPVERRAIPAAGRIARDLEVTGFGQQDVAGVDRGSRDGERLVIGGGHAAEGRQHVRRIPRHDDRLAGPRLIAA